MDEINDEIKKDEVKPEEIKTSDTTNMDATSTDSAKPEYITIDDLAKVQMKIGKVLNAEKIEGSEKLLKLSVDFAEEKPRQVLSGIAKYFTPEDIVGKSFPFITNLAPRKMMGLESQAMILAASDENGLALLQPTKDVAIGTELS